MTTPLPLLLASASPRRRQILHLLGLPFTVGVPPVDEDTAQDRYRGPIEELAQWLAKLKAAAALTLPEAAERLVITADTTVLLNGEVLGKPRDKAHARELLLSLRGRRHHVVTGVAVSFLENGRHRIESASCITPVLMRSYSEEEIASYIASGDPMDKAGAYGIQHPGFQPTKRIDGCYLNVVGLPLCVLVDLLAEFNVYPVGGRSAPIRPATAPTRATNEAAPLPLRGQVARAENDPAGLGTNPSHQRGSASTATQSGETRGELLRSQAGRSEKETACPWSEQCLV